MCRQGMQKTVVAQQGGFGTDTCRDRIIKEDITFEETEGLSHMNIWRENTPGSECRDPGAGAEQGFLRKLQFWGFLRGEEGMLRSR